jgi:hypothetical protein
MIDGIGNLIHTLLELFDNFCFDLEFYGTISAEVVHEPLLSRKDEMTMDHYLPH